MNQAYKEIVAPYKKQQVMKVLLPVLVMAASFCFAAVVPEDINFVFGLAGTAAFLYAMMTGFKALTLMFVRRKSHRALKKLNLLERAMADLEHAARFQVDEHCFGLTEKYLCLPHGVILQVEKLAWVYTQATRMRYMYVIPLGTVRTCQVKTVDGKETAMFYGKVKNDQAFKALLVRLLQYNPRLLIGHTAENQQRYAQRVAMYKAAAKAAER